jgi:hypothetical protein
MHKYVHVIVSFLRRLTVQTHSLELSWLHNQLRFSHFMCTLKYGLSSFLISNASVLSLSIGQPSFLVHSLFLLCLLFLRYME